MKTRHDRMDVLKNELRARNGRLSQAEAAELIGTSTRRLRAIVLESIGVGYRLLCVRIRSECAKELLERGLSIEETAERLEYSTRDKLEQAFKSCFGIRPSPYLRLLLQPERFSEETATQGVDNISGIGYRAPNTIGPGEAAEIKSTNANALLIDQRSTRSRRMTLRKRRC